MYTIHAVILAGGVGSRLSPLSRGDCPKQFLPILKNNISCFEQLARAIDDSCINSAFVAVQSQHYHLAREQFSCFSGEVDWIIEPESRNNFAPSLLCALRASPQSWLLFMPADQHLDYQTFLSAIEEIDESKPLHLWGVEPTHSDCRYGYIKHDDGEIRCFIEKPDAIQASQLIEVGALWNAGICLVQRDHFLGLCKKYQPHSYEMALEICCNSPHQGGYYNERYREFPELSIDHAILQPASSGMVHALHGAWIDLGHWATLETYWLQDGEANYIYGNVVCHECSGNIIWSPEVNVTAVGLNHWNIIIDCSCLYYRPVHTDIVFSVVPVEAESILLREQAGRLCPESIKCLYAVG